jgi:hypothetical protein
MHLHRIAVLLLVPLIAGGAFFDDFLGRVFGPTAPAYKAGEKISGKTKAYTLTLPDDGWLPLPEGRRATDADLELSGENGEAILVVFASCDGGVTLDDMVSYRRGEVGTELADLEVAEDRRFEATSFVPISTTRYSGTEMVGRRTYWVSAAVDGRLDVEVIVNVLGEEADDEKSAKAIVDSLEILGEDKGCANTG